MKSIILITIDCLRPDHMGVYGYKRDTTSRIDKLAENGTIFTHAFATGSSTPYSFTGIFSSTFPLDYTKIPSLKHPLRNSLTTILKENNYVTAGFHSNAYISSFFGYDRDFDVYYDLTKKKTTESGPKIPPTALRKIIRSIPLISQLARVTYKKYYDLKQRKNQKLAYLRAEETTSKVVEWLESINNDQLVFLWVHYMDPHHPYLSTEFLGEWTETKVDFSKSLHLMNKCSNKPGRITKKELELIVDLYDGEVKFVDSEVQRLLSAWDKKYPDSTIVLTADHGDEFREHGEFSHKAKLYDELIHVPLIITDPKVSQNENNDLVSLIDLPTTILNLQNIDVSPKMRGNSIFSKSYKPRDYIISETLQKEQKVSMDGQGVQKVALRGRKWKYIFHVDGSEELYDLENDPQEQKDISSEKIELTSELKQLVKLHLKHQTKSRIKIV
ncbi:MAG: sulfatase-like hydrolase/transferase [Candidatus Heimdallarchaeota archaeon]|nr:sulfatase-like hydrolase/transferase [Candidatus Heimdallarchaeota archaeon]